MSSIRFRYTKINDSLSIPTANGKSGQCLVLRHRATARRAGLALAMATPKGRLMSLMDLKEEGVPTSHWVSDHT